MSKLKIQFHVHTGQDPMDSIRHSERQAIDHAARLGYDVMAITCHNVVIFSDDLKKYAESKRVLLIPAIEKSIQRKHVLILNADVNAQKIQNFEDLKRYRQQKPDCFVIAAHPFYPGSISLQKKLEQNIDLFDAIEYSWYHSQRFNQYNKKAIKIAEKHGLPMVGTSDNHILKYFDQTFSLVEAEKNPKAIFEAIRKKKIHIVSHDLPWWKLGTIISFMLILAVIKKYTLK